MAGCRPGPAQAHATAGQIAAQIRQPALHFRNQVLRQITIPVGAAVSPEDGTSVDVLIDAADEALYRAKHAGRDRVVGCGRTG